MAAAEQLSRYFEKTRTYPKNPPASLRAEPRPVRRSATKTEGAERSNLKQTRRQDRDCPPSWIPHQGGSKERDFGRQRLAMTLWAVFEMASSLPSEDRRQMWRVGGI
jgi:hypothetical protein